jgi:hypothetical protein
MRLAKIVQQLQYYLSLGNASPSEIADEPDPISMEEYGFTSSSQLLALVSAVSVVFYLISSVITS